MFQWVCYEVVEWQIRLHEIVKCLPKLVLGSNVQPIFEQGTSRNFICEINAAAGRTEVALR